MIHKLILFVGLSVAACGAHAAGAAAGAGGGKHKAGSATTEAPSGSRPPWMLSARSGFLFGALDPDVSTGDWNHDSTGSYLGSLGLYYSLPRSWHEVYFFFGGDLGYLTSTERQTGGSAHAKLTTSETRLCLTGGVTWMPKFLAGRGGAFLFTSVGVWSELHTRLETESYSRNIKVSTQGFQLPFGVGVFYAFDEHWHPFVSVEDQVVTTSSGSVVVTSLGVNYGF